MVFNEYGQTAREDKRLLVDFYFSSSICYKYSLRDSRYVWGKKPSSSACFPVTQHTAQNASWQFQQYLKRSVAFTL